jgi:hypothetical protein
MNRKPLAGPVICYRSEPYNRTTESNGHWPDKPLYLANHLGCFGKTDVTFYGETPHLCVMRTAARIYRDAASTYLNYIRTTNVRGRPILGVLDCRVWHARRLRLRLARCDVYDSMSYSGGIRDQAHFIITYL